MKEQILFEQHFKLQKENGHFKDIIRAQQSSVSLCLLPRHLGWIRRVVHLSEALPCTTAAGSNERIATVEYRAARGVLLERVLGVRVTGWLLGKRVRNMLGRSHA